MKNLFTAALLLIASVTMAQKVQKISGDLNKLKGIKEWKVEFDYAEMKVAVDMWGKDLQEEATYTEKKVMDLNQKKEGRGQKWMDDWNHGKTTVYPEKFLLLLNKVAGKKGGNFSQEMDTQYVLKISTIVLMPGWNIGISKKPAFVSFQYTFYEVKDGQRTELAKFQCNNVVGSQMMGYDYTTTSRVQESYAKAGKILGKFLVKKAFKK